MNAIRMRRIVLVIVFVAVVLVVLVLLLFSGPGQSLPINVTSPPRFALTFEPPTLPPGQ